MKLRKTLTGILGVAVMALSVGSFSHVNEHKEVHAAETSITKKVSDHANANNWVNEKQYKTMVLDSYITATATGGDNTGKYYSSDNTWRFYANESAKIEISASGGCLLKSVVFTFNYKDSGALYNGGTQIKTGNTVSLANVPSHTFTIGQTSGKKGKIFFSSIKVTYELPEGDSHECSFEQRVVESAIKDKATCISPAVYYYSCECGENNKDLGTFTSGEALGHDYDSFGYCKLCDEYDDSLTQGERVQTLLNKYYTLEKTENGKYNRHTLININESTITEATAYFHDNVNMLERTTHFTQDALWMTNEAGTYSYYGTKGEDLTGGRVANVGETVESIAQKNTGGMEGKYTTLKDIRDYASKVDWEFDRDSKAYTTNDATVIKQFLDFTAPCFLNFTDTNSNYIILDHVSVKEEGNKLVLQLHINSGDASKLEVVDAEKGIYVLSTATISKYSVQQSGVLSEAVTITFDDKNKRTEYTTDIQVWKENGIVVTNTKDKSTNNVGDYSNPARFYKDSKIEITCNAGKFTTITINSPTGDNLTYLKNSLTSAGITHTVNGGIVTITFDEPTDTLSFTASGGQCRFNSITCE